ncbi:MAG: sugar ABC transporter substrate-binding protein [Lachnospiraceae bacterium]|nr:sugar ABC transporter substrate-binding protein [Lachnospiraceae bacterium]MBO4559717.1 sugar ABC transporter substrate-binding protein [Lachnospiraceae bacterium]
MKKLLSVLLVAVMLLSVVGCKKTTEPATNNGTNSGTTDTGKTDSGKTDSGKTDSGNTATTPDPDKADARGMKDGKFVETRHISVELYDRNVDGGTEAGNNAWTQWIQKQMLDRYNVEVEFVTVSRWQEADDINNLLAAQTAPDICYTYNYGAIQAYAEMGGVIDLAPVLEENKDLVPSLFDWLGDELVYQDLDPAEGTLWAIEGKRNETCRINTFIRQDWLDKLGLKTPTTKAELEQVLIAFRDNAETLLGADASKMVPFSTSYDIGWRAANIIESFMDPDITDKDYYVNGYDDRKFTEQGTKEAIRLLNKWYNDGLVWKDFAEHSGSDDTAEDDMIKAGFVGCFIHNYDYPFRGGKDSINATLAAQYGAQAKFVAINCFEDKNGKYTKYSYSNSGDRKTFFPATNDEIIASLCYLEFMSQASTVEFLQIGEEGVIHTVDAATGAMVIQAPDDAHHEWYQNSGKNIDMTINCNGLRLATEELTNISLAYSYSDVDPADVKQAIEAAKLDAKVPATPSVGDIKAETEATDLAGKRDQTYDKAVVASVADFDKVWDDGMKEYLNAGGQAIMDERKTAWENTYGTAVNIGK